MLHPDFRDLLAALSEERAEFLIVGAFALAAHGAPRATGDLDVFVRATAENAKRVWRALARWGAPLADVTLEDFQSEDLIYQVGVESVRIDIITGISGVAFEDAWRGHLELSIEGQVLPIIGVAEFIRNKRASGRPKDLLDAVTIERLHPQRNLPQSKPRRRSLRRSR